MRELESDQESVSIEATWNQERSSEARRQFVERLLASASLADIDLAA